MKYPPGTPTHSCAPPEFRSTPNITGSFELDRSIWANKNSDMRDRLSMYVGDPRLPWFRSYGPKTAYSGYTGLEGDD